MVVPDHWAGRAGHPGCPLPAGRVVARSGHDPRSEGDGEVKQPAGRGAGRLTRTGGRPRGGAPARLMGAPVLAHTVVPPPRRPAEAHVAGQFGQVSVAMVVAGQFGQVPAAVVVAGQFGQVPAAVVVAGQFGQVLVAVVVAVRRGPVAGLAVVAGRGGQFAGPAGPVVPVVADQPEPVVVVAVLAVVPVVADQEPASGPVPAEPVAAEVAVQLPVLAGGGGSAAGG